MSSLYAHQIHSSEHTNNRWRACPDSCENPEDLLKPGAWAMVASRFRIGDIIEVFPNDGSFFMMLVVRDCGQTWAKTSKVVFEFFGDNVATGGDDLLAEYEIRWGGPAAKFRVHRKSDGAVVSETGFPDKSAAYSWLLDYAKNMVK